MQKGATNGGDAERLCEGRVFVFSDYFPGHPRNKSILDLEIIWCVLLFIGIQVREKWNQSVQFYVTEYLIRMVVMGTR
jgi:hypothetical protein